MDRERSHGLATELNISHCFGHLPYNSAEASIVAVLAMLTSFVAMTLPSIVSPVCLLGSAHLAHAFPQDRSSLVCPF